MLAELRAKGFKLTVDGGTLLVEPRALLTEELRARIRSNKAAIIRELADEGKPRLSRWPTGRAEPYSNRRVRALEKRARHSVRLS